MQGTVLGAMGNTKSEHRWSLPARSSQSRKGGETQYTISWGDTSRRSQCQKPDTSAVGHRAPWGCFWAEKHGQEYKQDAGWAFEGEATWEKGHL